MWYDAALTGLSVAAQDDDYLYLIMEYLPGGDVMVRALPVTSFCAAVPCRFGMAFGAAS